jgi:hypothetical protein
MTFTVRAVRLLVLFGATVAAVTFAGSRGEAHKAITSKYTFNQDVLPIFRDKCGRCHVEGGVAPMSLMNYQDAFPWAESIRPAISSRMPPWNADAGFGELSTRRRSPRVTSTSHPRGQSAAARRVTPNAVLPVTLKNEWALGEPNVTLRLPEFTVAADRMEETQEFTVPTGTTAPRWVRAVDLLPGNPSIVRSATISLRAAPQPGEGPVPERVLARWLPGQDPEPTQDGTAFLLPAGAELSVRVHYKKTWQFERKVTVDRSTVGVYFAPGQSQGTAR